MFPAVSAFVQVQPAAAAPMLPPPTAAQEAMFRTCYGPDADMLRCAVNSRTVGRLRAQAVPPAQAAAAATPTPAAASLLADPAAGASDTVYRALVALGGASTTH